MQGKRATLAAPVEHALLLGRGCKVLKAATTTITTTRTPPSYLVQRDATKVLSLESLPPVLVLSLGRFAVYGKRQDTVTFPVDLELPADVLAHSVGARVTYILSARVGAWLGVVAHGGARWRMVFSGCTWWYMVARWWNGGAWLRVVAHGTW